VTWHSVVYKHTYLPLLKLLCLCYIGSKNKTEFFLILLLFWDHQCFDAVDWAAERASSLKKNWMVGCCMVIFLERGADLHMGHCHSLSLASVKSRLVLPFWHRLTRVVQDRRPLNGCVCCFVLGLSAQSPLLCGKWCCAYWHWSVTCTACYCNITCCLTGNYQLASVSYTLVKFTD